MPNWGVPNWLRPEDYPRPAGKEKGRIWAWQFLRRNGDCRTFWKLNIEPFIDPFVDQNGQQITRINRDCNGQIWPYHEELKSRFGVDLPSPPNSVHPPLFCL
jgi:hypothetical protein